MAFSKRVTIALTSNASGDVTAYSPRVTGMVQRVRYVPDPSTPLANTADLTITAEDSGAAILTITNQAQTATDYAPRMATHTTAGAAALYAAGGVAVLDRIPVANERIKAVCAQGGNALSGTLIIYVGD